MPKYEYDRSTTEQDFNADQIREILSKFKDKIISVDERNKLLAKDPSPISGCTSISLPYLLECLSSDKPSFYPYKTPSNEIVKQIYLIPTEEVFADLEPVEYKRTGFYIANANDNVSVFTSNEEYGRMWARYTLLRSLGLSDEQINKHPMYERVVALSDWLISALKKNQNERTHWESKYLLEADELLSQYGLSFAYYAELAELTHGVQVLYKDTQEVRDFFAENTHEVVDDVTFELRVPIPIEYIEAFVPLGKYEQSVMLKES